jgi:dihydroflavonol-4-reductase
MKVFLTGGTGFIGQALVGKIRARGWDLTVLLRDPKGAPAQWIAKKGGTLVQGDVTRADGLVAAMAGADVVIHNAGVYEIGVDAAIAARMQAVNVQGTENVLGAAGRAGAPRNLHVSSIVALGPSGLAPAPSAPADESKRHDARFLTDYERTKVEAHQAAERWRADGLPLSIVMPNAVVGANDHSDFGYFLRLTLLVGMGPIGFAPDAVYALVDVDALAEGVCLAAERARMGEDYLFCGEPQPLRALYDLWGRETRRMTPRVYVPRGVIRPLMALMEPLQRAAGLPAFMSRELVDNSRAHWNYSSAKAHRDLGWRHPAFADMWPPIIARERELMARRSGFLNKLRHQAVVEDSSRPLC